MTGALTEKGRSVLGNACKTCGSMPTFNMRTKQVYFEVPVNMKPCTECEDIARRWADDHRSSLIRDVTPAFTPEEEEPEATEVVMLNIEGVHTWFYNQESELRAPGWRHIEDL